MSNIQKDVSAALCHAGGAITASGAVLHAQGIHKTVVKANWRFR